ncbi:MAG: hypothetical protein M0R46_16855 [Candidatus Muirbacterium halophilum]|nr:hypothetical protein [Candidatus Muirbacterium halophilum]
MIKRFLTIIICFVFSFNIYAKVSEEVRENIIRQSKDIMRFIFDGIDDTSFIEKTYDIDYFRSNIKGGLDGISMVYDAESNLTVQEVREKDLKQPKLNIYHIEFSDLKVTIIQQSEWNQENLKTNLSFKEGIKKTREFIKKYRPDLDDYFYKVVLIKDYKESFILIFRIYYKGFQTTETINMTFLKTGLIKYLGIDNPLDYKIPEKIISYEEARKKVKEFIKGNYRNHSYYGDVYEKFKFIEPEESYKMWLHSALNYMDHGKPIFLHANTKVGKYKLKYFKDKNGKVQVDSTNLEKYGYTEKDFNYKGRYSNFSRLGYMIYIDHPVIVIQRGFAVFYVDAETGEIIGGV